MTGNDARKLFLEYFQKHHHQIVRSSSLVPRDDPSLLFVNAGMVQFKRTFLGEEKRSYNRAVTSQKCVRAGGKHNDLENVGYTARHHTFFEMLGNFSFGDYFKEKAIEFAWDLLINGYGLPPDKLYASVFLDDDEAHELWRKNIGLPEDRIVRFGEKDNFWAMGDTGPCGPCSEILIDRGAQYGCDRPDCAVGCECDRYLEIWNLVFMQFNRDADGRMTPLPKPSIDTGMGLERIVSVVQNAPTNYDTDLIAPIIARTEVLAQKGRANSFETGVAMKVIADHSRAAAFLVGDGVLPSNEGRGYVLRRILRRAIRYGRNIGLTQPFLHQTTAVVFDIMREAYPEIKDSAAFITKVIENEELRFSETLDHGLRVLTDTLAELQASGQHTIPGELIFKLYDTFGFPVDIVQDVVRDRNLALDMAGFESAMEAQRAQSRGVFTFTGLSEAYKELAARGFCTEFTGYQTLSAPSQIVLMVSGNAAVTQAVADQEIEVVTHTTPFYAESGGQVGDTGHIQAPGFEMVVTNTIKDPTGIVIHQGRVVSGSIATGAAVTLHVDTLRRQATARNHTATHLLHHALRQVLGEHVKQAGSLVSPERLRFDFSHFALVPPEALQQIEQLVNAGVRANIPLQVTEMDAESAFKSGAIALFEEKYGDRVRVVAIPEISQELCGGTHATATGAIGLFKILSEGSVAAGVRRIEAVTGAAALQHVQELEQRFNQITLMLRVKPEEVAARCEKLLAAQKNLEKQIDQLKGRLAEVAGSAPGKEVQTINGVSVIIRRVEVDTPAQLRDVTDRLRNQVTSGIIVLGSVVADKVLLIVRVTDDLVSRYAAGKIIKPIAAIVGGSGGGRPDMAQAGGNQPAKLDDALAQAAGVIKDL